MRLGIFALAVSLPLLATPLAAADGRYVVCDNGLRCVKAPCPSSIVRNLASGEDIKGISPDIGGLPDADQQRIRDMDALYSGRLVLNGHVETRDRETAGTRHNLPLLVVTGIERETTAAERLHCPSG